MDEDPFSGGDSRSLDSEENLQGDAYSQEGFQDPEGWHIITQS